MHEVNSPHAVLSPNPIQATDTHIAKKYITKITNNELRAGLAAALDMKNNLIHEQRLIHDEALEYQRIGKYTKEIQDRLNKRSNKLIEAYKAQVEHNKQLAEEVRELYYKRSEL